jgi:tetratricopeptide (TPR) repeat protein
VYQRLARHPEAIRDATQALTLSRGGDPDPWNERAYVRAIAGLELEEGLDDVQQAIDLYGAPNAAYLDTRGYLYHLLGRQEEALTDLNEAIALAEREDPWGAAHERRPREGRGGERDRRRHDENLSVLYHHRGLVLAALGRDEEAQADLTRAESLGYNPAGGVY